jgi:hypothetical protein
MQIHSLAPNPAIQPAFPCSLFCDAKAKISLMVHRRCGRSGLAAGALTAYANPYCGALGGEWAHCRLRQRDHADRNALAQQRDTEHGKLASTTPTTLAVMLSCRSKTSSSAPSRTALNAILGYTELMADLGVPEQAQDYEKWGSTECAGGWL